ncbi:MAG: MoaD/ThiS family protein [Methylococcaceae bacterium]|nr:MoaD/ThiS family protein [Methylococcaceae bacterium]
MSIKVRYFASLSEKAGKSESDMAVSRTLKVSEVWRLDTGGIAMPDNLLAAVNMEYADLEAQVYDGDEVAFFPPVTGG